MDKERGEFARQTEIARLQSDQAPWDLLIVGGGATGIATALEASARGYRVALVEQSDFGKGTSSRSTKLIHGGVRYLRQGEVGLVRDALHERGRLLSVAPHLVYPLRFHIPITRFTERAFYWLGLKLYDRLAGSEGIGPAASCRLAATLAAIPNLRRDQFGGSVSYWDAGFDDTRLLIEMAQTASQLGACCVNYVGLTELPPTHRGDHRRTAILKDALTGEKFELSARVVVNCCGPFVDSVARLDNCDAATRIAPSQGVHLVVDRSFLGGDDALMIPETSDGRVLFAIPWQGKTVIGTTDTPIREPEREPRAKAAEIDYLLSTIAPYLEQSPCHDDISSTFVGIRPLVQSGSGAATSKLSRDHVIEVSRSGLVSVMGGKWTTCRLMAQDAVDAAVRVGELPAGRAAPSELPLVGTSRGEEQADFARDDGLAQFGSRGVEVAQWCEREPHRHESLTSVVYLPRGLVSWYVEREMASTVEDILARRTRLLFLDVAEAVRLSEEVAQLMADALGKDRHWEEKQVSQFKQLVAGGGR